MLGKLEELNLSCPFTWGLRELIQDPTAMCNSDIEEFELDGVPEITFIVRVVRLFKTALTKDNADQLMGLAEDALQALYQEEKASDLGRPAEHILYATQLYFYEARGATKALEAKLQQGNSDPWRHDSSKLSESEQAAIDGWKSFTISLFPLYRIDEGISLAKRAIAAQPTNALWHLVYGHFLRKRRRNTDHRSSPCPLELSCFTNAATYSENAFYHVSAIQSQHEAAFSRTRPHPQIPEWQAYVNILPQCNDAPGVLLKVALGLIRSNNKSPELRDKVHSILDRVDELSPNNPTYYHYRSMAYRNQGRKELELHYLKLAADKNNFSAALVYLNNLYQSQSKKEAIDFGLTMIERFKKGSPRGLQRILLNVAIMYHTIPDYKSSAKYFLEAIETWPTSGSLSEPYYFAGIKMRSVYEYLRTTFLPLVRKKMATDSELLLTVQKLKRYCDLPI